MAMTYDAFLDQMKKDLEAGFAEDLPAKYSQVKIGIRDVEKLQGESYRGISFRDRRCKKKARFHWKRARYVLLFMRPLNDSCVFV